VRSLLALKKVRDELRAGYDLIRAQRDALVTANKQREELTAFLVHDLKNLLQGLLANAEFLVDCEDVRGAAREAVHDVRIGATSMYRMVLNLFDIQRSEDGSLVPRLSVIDVGSLLDAVRAEFMRRAAERGIKLEMFVETTTPKLRADRDLLRRLLENLLDNAMRYSPANGTVRVSTFGQDDAIELRVQDDGPGVPAEHRERIFEKFVRLGDAAARASHRNRGLGLAFCRLAASVHGGRVWVEDAEPRGSRFCVRIPADGAVAQRTPP